MRSVSSWRAKKRLRGAPLVLFPSPNGRAARLGEVFLKTEARFEVSAKRAGRRKMHVSTRGASLQAFKTHAASSFLAQGALGARHVLAVLENVRTARGAPLKRRAARLKRFPQPCRMALF